MRERELQCDIFTMERERVTLQGELSALPLEHQKSLSENQRAIDTLEPQLAEADSLRQIVLTAPQSGIVSALQLEHGNSVRSDLPVLSIIPAGSELEALLYLPTRAIGFIEKGQPVLLRYRAFPYQKFGHYEGVIAEVARSTVRLQDLPTQLRGAGNTADVNEPVYPVKVRLLRQSISAYGCNIDLQPAMELDADVLIENRRLIEWVLEPLYTLTVKNQRMSVVAGLRFGIGPRFPVLLQTEATECGMACLGTLITLSCSRVSARRWWSSMIRM